MSARAIPDMPRESDEPVLQFVFAKRMLYRTRMWSVGVLVALGMIVQVAFLSVWPGVPFLAVAVALSWVVGFDNKLDRRGLKADSTWCRTPFERIPSIVQLDKDMQRWDASAVDVSSPIGCIAMFAVVALIGALTMGAAIAFGFAVAAIVALDATVLVLVQWFSGMRTVHRKPDLVLKAKHLRDVVGAARTEIDAAGTLHGQLLLSEHDAGAAPDDARILIDVKDPPGKMLAIQGQVVLNRVQGKPYPYFYCVALAESGSGLARFADRFEDRDSATTIEVKSEDDVDVVVVRQTTSKTSGYHTKSNVSKRLLVTALDIATGFRDRA